MKAMKTRNTILTAASMIGLLWLAACGGKADHRHSGGAEGGSAGQSATGGSEDGGSTRTGGGPGTGGRSASGGTGGRASSTGGAGPTTGATAGAVSATGGAPTGGTRTSTGGITAGGVEQSSGGAPTGGVEQGTGGIAAGGVEQSSGGIPATAGAAGSSSEPPIRLVSEPSPCGGFTPLLSDSFGEQPSSNGDDPPGGYCAASLLRWACSSYATGGLWVELTRLEYQCCADLRVNLSPEGDGYRLSVVDEAEEQCNCICSFDVQAFVERPCEPTTVFWADQSFELAVEDRGSGQLLVSAEPSSFCEPIENVDSDEIVQALAGGTMTFHVSRTWVHNAGLMPVEEELAAVDDAPTWTIVFSEDGSSVTLSEAGSEFNNYTGTRLEGDPLIYDLSPATGGQLVIVRRGSGYSAQITLYGSGLPITQCVVGELSAEA
jgi:hypothetical protein